MAAFSSYNQQQNPFLFDSVLLQQSNNAAMESSSVTDKYESISECDQQAAVTSMVELEKKNKRKRKPITSSSNSAQSKDMREVKKKKSSEDDQKGYIHVRARRGQATDSHSLAERVRREKMSERMRALQALVPGCDKITGKALMLDEIINYVQSLQNQVEFLSMKLAYVNPMLYDFGTDLDAFGLLPNESLNSLASQLPTVQECSPTQPSVIHETSNSLMSPNANANGYSLVDNSSNFPFLFQQGHLLNNLQQVYEESAVACKRRCYSEVSNCNGEQEMVAKSVDIFNRP